MSEPIFDLEGILRAAFARMGENKLGIQEGTTPPKADLAEPSKVEPSEVEQKFPEQSAGSEPVEQSLKQDSMPMYSPKQRTRNFERFVL